MAIRGAELLSTMDPGPDGSVGNSRIHSRVEGEAVFAGMKKYTNIQAPVLAIYVTPHSPGHSLIRPWALQPGISTAARIDAEAAKALPSCNVYGPDEAI